jgi:2-polyprenyl-3-methyl-5-hydroxy-6-metoxy-1,4-benzoquinol methylase
MSQKTASKKHHSPPKGVRLRPRTILEAKKQAAPHLARYKLAEKLIAGKNVCDVACGVGYGSRYLAKTALKVTGMDISAEAIEWAGKYFSVDNVRFLVADAAEPWPVEDKFDVITSFETMEHLESPEAFLRNVYDHLLPSGVLFLSVPNGPRDKSRTDNPYHLHHFTDVGLKALIREYFSQMEFFSQKYKKDFKHYGTKFLRKTGLLNKQPYFINNYFLVSGLREDLKTWLVIARK